MKTIQDLNIAERNLNRLAPCPAPAAPGCANRVWLVDDDQWFRSLLARLLGRISGLECSRGFGSPDALLAALARETPPDTILLDVYFPDQNGLEYIPRIKSLAPATCLLILTTFYDSDRAFRALQAGAAGFLVKSATLDEIAERILQTDKKSIVNKVPNRSAKP